MVGRAVAAALIAATTNPYWLLPARVLYGMSWISMYAMAVARLGDAIPADESGVALGMLTTAMGVGFAAGPLLGAAVMVAHGIRASYLVASAGGIVAITALRPSARTGGAAGVDQPPLDWRALRPMLRDPNLRAASLGNLMIDLSFNAAVLNFFPRYAAALHVSQTATNSMFAARATGSTVSRVPAGIVIGRTSGWTVLLASLGALTVVLFSLGLASHLAVLAVLLGLEGILFGVILTADQTLTPEISRGIPRRRAIGLYSLAGSLGNGLGSARLGLVAQQWGVWTVFECAGAAVLAALAATLGLRARLGASSGSGRQSG